MIRVDVEGSSTRPGRKRTMLWIDARLAAGGETSVVLVDDDVSVAEMYRLGLERNGFNVTIARGGGELLESLKGRPPDIIVLDYELSGGSGAEVLEMIRGDECTKGVRTFLLTNFAPTDPSAIEGRT